jgi:hypothetical protein
MTTDTKLTKVLEYLIKNEEDKARELLHQVFIEKARAIHEELMSTDEDMDTDMDETMHDSEMDEMVGGTGDMGKDLTNEIEAMEDEVDFEETMSEDDSEEEMDITAEEPADDMESMGDSGDMSAIEKSMHSLEDALAELKAEFEKLEAGSDDTDSEEMDVEVEAGEEDASAEEAGEEDQEEEAEAEEGEEEEMDETWSLDEDFDDLAESLDLEVVTKDMEKSQKTAGDVGSASSGMGTGKDAKSPTPPSQTTRMGAKPVETGKGPTAKGYNLETPPKSGKLPIEPVDNRRKKATDDTKKMSKEGAPAAKLNHPEPAKGNEMSPLSKGGQNLK